jgi:hypothetical protein
MDLASINAARGAHVRDDAHEGAVLEQAEGLYAGFAADHGISTALESGPYIGHDGGLILDEQHRERRQLHRG